MDHHLEKCSLKELYRLHEAIFRVSCIVCGDEQRPIFFDGQGGRYLAEIHGWLSGRLDDIKREMEGRPVKSYEEAIMLFNMRAHCLDESAGEHYEEVLKLLAHAKAQAA